MYDLMSISPSVVLLLLGLVFVVLKRSFAARSGNPQRLPYPPGPRPKPVIGNLLDVPKETAWLTYTEWGKRYGDIIYMNVLGNDLIIINSTRTANELFEKRSYLYADRPKMPVLQFMGWDFNFGLLPYGEEWRHRHKVFHQSLQPKSPALQPVVLYYVYSLLRKFLETPEEFQEHIKNFSASIVMHSVYGREVAPKNDRFVALSEETVHMLTYAVFPGAQLMNAFPILQKFPAWFPGAGFKRIALKCREMCNELQTVPFERVKNDMESGAFISSMTSRLIEEGKESDEVIKSVTTSAFIAGADTTMAALSSFILVLVQNPEVQRTGQEEISRVLGSNRLPGFEDRALLPYCEAIMRELLRWTQITPLGVAHRVSENDIYNGYFIPKGATVIGNTWAMTHDEEVYPEPNAFKPERFLASDGTLVDDDTRVAFGFGRRVCAGRPIAEASLWSAIVLILATFEVAKAKDEYGSDIDVSGEFTDSIACHPVPFQCSIKPRSTEARHLVEETVSFRI